MLYERRHDTFVMQKRAVIIIALIRTNCKHKENAALLDFANKGTTRGLVGDEGRLQWLCDDQCVLFTAEGFLLHQTGLTEQAYSGLAITTVRHFERQCQSALACSTSQCKMKKANLRLEKVAMVDFGVTKNPVFFFCCKNTLSNRIIEQPVECHGGVGRQICFIHSLRLIHAWSCHSPSILRHSTHKTHWIWCTDTALRQTLFG